MQLSCKNDLATFWTILGKIGQLFIPSSGHTDDDDNGDLNNFLLKRKLFREMARVCVDE